MDCINVSTPQPASKIEAQTAGVDAAIDRIVAAGLGSCNSLKRGPDGLRQIVVQGERTPGVQYILDRLGQPMTAEPHEPVDEVDDTDFLGEAKAKAKRKPKPNGHDGEPVVLSHKNPYSTAATYLELHRNHRDGRTLHLYRGSWHAYAGTHYRDASTDEIKAALYQFLDGAVCKTKGEDGKFRTEAFKPTRKHLLDLIDTVRARALVLDDVQVPSWLGATTTKGPVVPLKNGLLDLATGHLHDHSPAYFQTYSLPFAYDPCASEPVEWLKFLSTIWPSDPEAIATLQEIFGLLLTEDTSHHKLFLVVGPPRSGKGTIARVLQELLGKENVAGPTLASLAELYGLQPLIGKPAAVIADARLSGRSDAQLIAEKLLSISGEDRQTIPRKYLDAWSGTMSTRFLLLTNKLPAIADASGAMTSRFVILMMTETFLGREDHGLLARLLPELPGIFNWALVGRSRLAERGHFVMPKSSAEAVEEMRRQSSPIAVFIDECLVKNVTSEITPKAAYDEWCSWCRMHGRDKVGTLEMFGSEFRAAVPGLKIRQPREGGARVRYYQGYHIKGQSQG